MFMRDIAKFSLKVRNAIHIANHLFVPVNDHAIFFISVRTDHACPH